MTKIGLETKEIKKALKQHRLYLAYQAWEKANPKTRGEEPPKGIRFALKDLYEADLREADLSGADLREADLRWADLSEAYLSGADLREANLREADLREANLWEANLEGANLHEADLRKADLRKANLWRAVLRWADLRGANLEGANLMSANLRGAIGNGRVVKSIQADKYPITWTNTDLAIGCQQHPLADWLKFTDEKKAEFADDALEYLNKWLPILDSMGVFDAVNGKEVL